MCGQPGREAAHRRRAWFLLLPEVPLSAVDSPRSASEVARQSRRAAPSAHPGGGFRSTAVRRAALRACCPINGRRRWGRRSAARRFLMRWAVRSCRRPAGSGRPSRRPPSIVAATSPFSPSAGLSLAHGVDQSAGPEVLASACRQHVLNRKAPASCAHFAPVSVVAPHHKDSASRPAPPRYSCVVHPARRDVSHLIWARLAGHGCPPHSALLLLVEQLSGRANPDAGRARESDPAITPTRVAPQAPYRLSRSTAMSTPSRHLPNRWPVRAVCQRSSLCSSIGVPARFHGRAVCGRVGSLLRSGARACPSR